MLLSERGARDEAASLLEQAAADLGSLVTGVATSILVADRYAILADDFRALGRDDRARDGPPGRGAPGPAPRAGAGAAPALEESLGNPGAARAGFHDRSGRPVAMILDGGRATTERRVDRGGIS